MKGQSPQRPESESREVKLIKIWSTSAVRETILLSVYSDSAQVICVACAA